jgi:hypothetical protein
MPVDVSSVTGEIFYSGPWSEIQEILRVLNIGEGKLAQVTEIMTNHYQEMVDREIDALLNPLYQVPLRAMNQIQPDGSLKRVFPGDIRRLAKYWVAGLMLLNEFQNLSQNVTDQAQAYVDDSRKALYAIIRFNHRIPGQEFKSQISKTLPAAIQPPSIPEANF